MVSRKKILSRSRDDLDNLSEQDEDKPLFTARFEEDVWYTKQKLFSDHIEEIFKKWDSIDDEIWAKAIVMERNRRVAKAYARAPVLTINGGEGGFDGFRLGLNGFSNPMRDEKIEEFKETIGLGAKVKMDESGNILIKRLSKSPVFLKTALEDSSLSTDILGIANGLIELEKPLRIFDMRKFQQSINRELRRTNPDRVRLEHQCVVSLCFVKDEEELLDSPIWVVLINIVALEMLKAKLPQSTRVPMYKMHNGERRFPLSGSSDEDPYSLNSGHNSSGSSNLKEKEEKNSGILLKKEKDYFGPQNWSATQDRRRDRSRDNFLDEIESATLKPRTNNRRRFLKKTTTEDKKKKVVDDPYYCGFKARVPEFASSQQHTSSQPQQQNNNNTKELNGYKDKWVDKNNWIDREDREWTEAKERDPWEEPEDRKPMDKDRMWLEPTSGARDKEKMWMDSRPPVTKENNWTDTRAPISKDNMWTDSRPKYRDQGAQTPGRMRREQVVVPNSHSAPNLAQIPKVQPFWWQSRLYPDQSRVFNDQGRGGFPEQTRRYQDMFHGKSGVPVSKMNYFERLPFSYGNEFSSLQFNRGIGAGIPTIPQAQVTTQPRPAGSGMNGGPSSQQQPPATQTTKPRRKFFSRQNMFKSSKDKKQ